MPLALLPLTRAISGPLSPLQIKVTLAVDPDQHFGFSTTSSDDVLSTRFTHKLVSNGLLGLVTHNIYIINLEHIVLIDLAFT